MADTVTTNTSKALYRFLCKTIVGTERHLNTMRLLHTIRDSVVSDELCTQITSGSFGEGLEMRGSDLDMMYVFKFIEVCENIHDIKKPFNLKVVYFSMDTDDVKPGFTQLLLQGNSKFLFQYIEEFDGKHYFSNTQYKEDLMRNTEMVVHGPCVSDPDGTYDNARSLHCKKWISPAVPWITRSRNSWPKTGVIQSIIKHGVLFVPVGVKGSPKEDIEWRISFSVGEKFLINTFTHTQLLCYALLKILLKDLIATDTECKDLLCSYFLKTIMFWISEELPLSVWKPDNLIHCFMRCFSRLIYCVEYSALFHYFIPENNMFENRIVGSYCEILLQKLVTLHSYGWRCLLFSDQLSNFHASMWMVQIEPHELHISDVEKTLNSRLLHMSNDMISFFVWTPYLSYIYMRGIHQVVSCEESILKYVYTYHISLWCAQYAQFFPLNSTRKSNKHQYKLYNSCLCILLQNIYHDTVSGWLMLASFFCKAKQYRKALHIIMYSISKCTPEKLCRFMDMSDIHHQLLKLKSFQKKSVVQLWKIIYVDILHFQRKSALIPDELKMDEELGYGSFYFPSLAYAYFLKFLCHYHQNNTIQCHHCIKDLKSIITANYFINSSDEAEAYNLLGITLQMIGDIPSARQAFMQSFKLFPVDSCNAAGKRLSLMTTE